MNVLKVQKINDDGSIAFEGMFGPNEVRYILEQGVNLILQEGAATIEGLDEDDFDEEDDFNIVGPDTVQ